MRSLSASVSKISGWRLLLAAILLHATLAVAISAIGRIGLAPAHIDRDGIIPAFAFDSYGYQRGMLSLVEMLHGGELMAWVVADQPVHVKLISISSAVMGPLVGYGTLSAEPFNALCYAAIIFLVFALGRAIAGRAVGLFAAAAVALWPSLLLHSLQFLKDPLFIVLAIALVWCLVIWMTRSYSPRAAVLHGFITFSVVLLIALIRVDFVVFIAGLMLFGLLALATRQLIERRLLPGNLISPLPALAIAAVVIMAHQTSSIERFKRYPPERGGEQKSQPFSSLHLPTAISYLPHVAKDSSVNRSGQPPWHLRLMMRINQVRSKFITSYPESGSTLDRDVVMRDWRALIFYLPRAFEIGCWAPFPGTWMSAGSRVGSAGKLLSAAEMILIYGWQLLAIFALVWSPRAVAPWLLCLIIVSGFAGLGLLVPNVGALYRFRYAFWILLIVLGAKGLQSLFSALAWKREGLRKASDQRSEYAERVFRVVPGIFLSIWACSLSFNPSGHVTLESVIAQSPASSDFSSEDSRRNLDFRLVNATSASIVAVYVSSSESSTWEEDLISGSKLSEGDELMVRFNPHERNVLWDIKVEDRNGHYAELTRLRLTEISQITLSIKVYPQDLVMAEIE